MLYIYIYSYTNKYNKYSMQLPFINIIKIKVFNTYKLSFNISDQRCICVIRLGYAILIINN